ncbi:MAG: L,D-transpeptidase [Ktedonobacteraceae bacterium]
MKGRASLMKTGRGRLSLHAAWIPRLVSVIFLIGVIMMTSACGGSPQSQQQASQSKTQLDQLIRYAQQIGVPVQNLAPIQRQEQQVSSAGAPFSPFNDQVDTDYYRHLATQYTAIQHQLQALITTTTDRLKVQASQSLQAFRQVLSHRQTQKIGNLRPFFDQYIQDQSLFSQAHYPKDFGAVSQNAQQETQALGQMGFAFDRLTFFKNMISQMQAARLDVTAMQVQYKSDLALFNSSATSTAFRHLDNLIEAQYQLAVGNATKAFPSVGVAWLSEFQQQISLLKTYGFDPAPYQKRYNADQAVMRSAKTIQAYLAFAKRIDADLALLHKQLLTGEANHLMGELNNEAAAWGNAHPYQDQFDGHNYLLDSGYTMNGIGYWLQVELSQANTLSDYQAVVNDGNDELFSLRMLEQDYSDKTLYNQPHQTDLELIQHYQLSGQIIVVSMMEQTMRVYENGKLVRAFFVTTGRVELPSLPGHWTALARQAPTEFTSSDPPDSPYWYPPTPINYAINYHSDGYFIHDAWWRGNFGPGTQFPHYDVGGDEAYARNGSHGCINMPENDAAWLYANTNYNTQIIVY